MRLLGMGKTGICALAAMLCLASWAGGKEITINSQSATNPGNNTYRTLEEFRQALVANPGILADGDVVNLHDAENTIVEGLVLPPGIRVTIRGVNGVSNIGTDSAMLLGAFVYNDYVPGLEPHIVLENVRMAGNDRNMSSNASITTNVSAAGTLEIRNSVFEDNVNLVSGGATLFGHGELTIVNSVIRNNTAFIAGAVLVDTTNSVGNAVLNVVMDENAPDTITWSGNKIYEYPGAPTYSNAVALNSGENLTIDMNVNIADGKTFHQADGIQGMLDTDAVVNINKIGGGTWKLDRDSYFHRQNTVDSAVNINIAEGRLHFKDTMLYSYGLFYERDASGDLLPTDFTVTGNLNVARNAIFKPSIHIPESHIPGTGSGTIPGGRVSFLYLQSFDTAEGAKLEVGGISKAYGFGEYQVDGGTLIDAGITGAIALVTEKENSEISSTMVVDNRLMHAWLEWDTDATSGEDFILLQIGRVNNLSTLPGAGNAIDIYRLRDDLSEEERDWLDDIYNRGGLYQSELGFLQTLNGDVVMLSQVAMRNNLANALRKISRRTTGFQDEELQIDDSCGDPNAEISRYGKLWAYLDQSWTRQDTGPNLAGYKYNPTSLGIGYDHHNDQWIVGGLLSFDTGRLRLRSEKQTHTDVQSLVAGVYASYAVEGIYITGGLQAGYGWNRSKSHYDWVGHRADANSGAYGTRLLGANAEIGYMMGIGRESESIRVTPYTGMSYARISREGFRETGAGILDRQFRASRWNMFDWTLGVRVSKPVEFGGMTIIPSLDLALARTMGTPGARDGGGDAHFADHPLGAWRIGAYDQNRNALRLGGGATAKVRENLDVGLDYDFEWRNRFFSHQINLNMSLGF